MAEDILDHHSRAGSFVRDRPGHASAASVVFAVLGLIGTALTTTWYTSGLLTGLQRDFSALDAKVTIYNNQRNNDFASLRAETAQQIGTLDRRITALETSRTASDQQLAATTASIAGLQAQTSAMQGAVNDLRDGINAIRIDVGNIARAANGPLGRR
ncbi:MAG: hypothetical protein RQ966_15080 [Acetobacteraceae bacterium]|nr:hypothetical protein [Acetobacteraceae bacterium]